MKVSKSMDLSYAQGDVDKHNNNNNNNGRLRHSLSEIKFNEGSFFGPVGFLYIGVASLFAVIFFFNRNVVAKGLSIPPLVGLIFEYRKKIRLGWSACSILAVALLLHAAGDVVIKMAGVIESMPFFLTGHMVYARSFARGGDFSRSRIARLSWGRRVAMVVIVVYSWGAWLLLRSSFVGPLKPVLASYICAISLMFVLSLFGRSRLLIAGTAMYVASDSLIALASFVWPHSPQMQTIELMLAWPIYFVGQVLITVGALNTFSDLHLSSDPNVRRTNSSKHAEMLILFFGLVASFIAARRVFFAPR